MRRVALLAAGAAATAAAAGCGAGSFATGPVRVTLTRDYGARVAAPARSGPARAGDTLGRVTDRLATLPPAPGTRWSGWINGLAALPGAPVHAGDRILWDRHRANAPASAAVVAQFPEPFLHGTDGRRPPLRLECAAGTDAACATAAARLSAAGVSVNRAVLGAPAGRDTARILLGPWPALRSDAAAAQLARGPAASGVFARPLGDGTTLALLGARGTVRARAGAGTGLVAATRFAGQQPTWIVLGADPAGLRAAAASLTPGALRDRFALVVRDGRRESVP